ncbi:MULTISPECIES: cob(I)yrinic acid a,c-diamide adenosyltransferase [Salimicrobium]|uniref:Corrinoid adenosyltransferase n=1 Tax=Salimicrobium humidisoli TaxID=2029857 RepID=A0ABX4HQS7_9BACI|nr:MULTISPECIES: cob(I)yrinic acid a,c-diamide adenosyltransferase [Salimicrobium]PBB04931.1 ATP:cob(I)alamin adenosyltransferase [Salimicrobium humidisoli]
MRIYTRSGDKGKTSLIHGDRVPKSHQRVEAYGTCDEANSVIGVAISYLRKEDFTGRDKMLEEMNRIQTILFHVGAELATPKGKEVFWQLKKEHVSELEALIDQWDEDLPDLKNFILPTGVEAAAHLHMARTVVRRAERYASALEEELNNPLAVSYLNRLSDLLFVAARYVNHTLEGTETNLDPDV